MKHPEPPEDDDDPLVAVPVGGGAAPDELSPSPGGLQPDHVEAYSRFYRVYIKRLTTYLVYQGASVHLAAELAQETMTKAYLKWPTITWPRPWAYTVAYKAFIRHATRVVERPVEEVPEPTPVLPRPDEAEAWVQEQVIVEVLRALPPRQRQVLALTLDGWKPAQIAEMLRIDDAAVRSSLLKARRAAAEYLKSREEE
jgi:RNA polymerase sigma-70 factor (ECF subfamily)